MEQNQQLSFADVEYAHKGKVTRRQKFLAQFEALLPWRAERQTAVYSGEIQD